MSSCARSPPCPLRHLEHLLCFACSLLLLPADVSAAGQPANSNTQSKAAAPGAGKHAKGASTGAGSHQAGASAKATSSPQCCAGDACTGLNSKLQAFRAGGCAIGKATCVRCAGAPPHDDVQQTAYSFLMCQAVLVLTAYPSAAACLRVFCLQVVVWTGATAVCSTCMLDEAQWCRHLPPGPSPAQPHAMQQSLCRTWSQQAATQQMARISWTGRPWLSMATSAWQLCPCTAATSPWQCCVLPQSR